MGLNFTVEGQYPPDIPHREEMERYGNLYAGRSSGRSFDILNPDPELAKVNTPYDKDRKTVRPNIVADLVSSIASLEIGEHVDIKTGDDTVDLLLQQSGFDNTLLSIAEEKSAFGGCYVRVVYEPELSPTPEFIVTPPTHVAPVFRGNRLVSASMWQTVKTNGSTVWRWVEHRDNQARTITNLLYKGTEKTWGEQKPLDTISETAGLKDAEQYPDGVERLVFYVPNLLPNRRHLTSAQGRSDFAGSESQLAGLDLLYTSLIRDFRLGRARIVVPVEALNRQGGGATFEQDREVYTTLDIDPSSEGGKPTILQGAIRAQEHLSAIQDLMGRVVSSAGFAPVSFGLGDLGNAQSGTALRVREGKTISTIQAKRRYLLPAVLDMVKTFAALTGKPVDEVRVEWPAVRSESGLDLANMVNTLTAAGAMSTVQAVETLHPDWTSAQVAEEVSRIQGDAGQSVALPQNF